jgi:hypothetical protein
MGDFRLGMDLVDVREVQASFDPFGARYPLGSPRETARLLGDVAAAVVLARPGASRDFQPRSEGD